MEVLTQLELMSNSAISGFVKLKDMSLHVSIKCILKEVWLDGWWYIRRRRRAQNIGAHIHRRGWRLRRRSTYFRCRHTLYSFWCTYPQDRFCPCFSIEVGSAVRRKLYLPEGVAVSLRIRSRGAKSLEATKYRPTTSEVATLMGKHSGGRCNSSKCSWEQNHAWWQVWHSMEEADFPHK